MFSTVTFNQSTLVSVCPAASHTNHAQRRFPLFHEKASKKTISPNKRDIAIDLHTSNSPIMVCGCKMLKDLFTPTEGPTDPLILYVVKRSTGDMASKYSALSKLATYPTDDAFQRMAALLPSLFLSKQSTYLADDAWQPSVTQTPRGMAALLSSLYVLATSVSCKGVTAENNVLSALYAITRFPPAVRACTFMASS
jgi:hypothetical protein